MEQTSQIRRGRVFKVAALGAESRERLEQLARSNGDAVRFSADSPMVATGALVAAIVWFAVYFFLTDSLIWSRPKAVGLAVVSVAAAILLARGAAGLLSRFWPSRRSFTLATRLYFLECLRGRLVCWRLDELDSITVAGTKVRITAAGQSFELTPADGLSAADAVDEIIYFRKLTVEADARGDNEYFTEHRIFSTADFGRSTLGAQSKANLAGRLAMVGGAVILAAGAIVSASALNVYFDDRISFRDATAINTASMYRGYLATHPNGAFRDRAEERLTALYDEAERKYRASLAQRYDPRAADAVSALLRYARETRRSLVELRFERKVSIPDMQTLARLNDTDHLIPIDKSFFDQRMSDKETELRSLIGNAFQQVIPDDIVEFTDRCDAECPAFNIRYEVLEDGFYTDKRLKSLPEKDRYHSVGILINWDFVLSIPGRPDGFSFRLDAKPAETIDFKSSEPADVLTKETVVAVLTRDNESIYAAMFESAFDDFREGLLSRLGFRIPVRKDKRPAASAADGEK